MDHLELAIALVDARLTAGATSGRTVWTQTEMSDVLLDLRNGLRRVQMIAAWDLELR